MSKPNLSRILDRAVDHMEREGIIYMMELLAPVIREWRRHFLVAGKTATPEDAANVMLLAIEAFFIQSKPSLRISKVRAEPLRRMAQARIKAHRKYLERQAAED